MGTVVRVVPASPFDPLKLHPKARILRHLSVEFDRRDGVDARLQPLGGDGSAEARLDGITLSARGVGRYFRLLIWPPNLTPTASELFAACTLRSREGAAPAEIGLASRSPERGWNWLDAPQSVPLSSEWTDLRAAFALPPEKPELLVILLHFQGDVALDVAGLVVTSGSPPEAATRISVSPRPDFDQPPRFLAEVTSETARQVGILVRDLRPDEPVRNRRPAIAKQDPARFINDARITVVDDVYVLVMVTRKASRKDLVFLPDRDDPAEQVALPAIAGPTELAGQASYNDRFLTLWPTIQEDLRGLQDVVSQLTPTNVVKNRLFPKALPTPFVTGNTIRAVMNRLPDAVSHLLIARWQASRGGAETVTANLIAALSEQYRAGELCIFDPDQDSVGSPALANQGIPVITLNDIEKGLSFLDRVEITDRILSQLRTPIVHSMNSLSGWINFSERGRFYAQDSRLFGNVYSDLRLADGTPAAYFFWQSLPETIDWMSGVMGDNLRVLAKARDYFGLLPSHLERLHVVYTPVLGLRGGDPTHELRRFGEQRSKRSLWMSRIATEKRLDVLAAIAARCPDRHFSLYGSATTPVDLSALVSLDNVSIVGEFARLADLPVATFDSYVFTSSAEGMPISILEVAALGLPIVAPDVGGIGEFIDRETGWLVSGPNAVEEYVRALDEIHRSPAEARRRVTAAQQRLLERHTWKAYRESLARVPGYFGERR